MSSTCTQGHSRSEAPAVRDWLKLHETLLEAERELAAKAERYARGEIDVQELDQASEKTVALRELSLAVLERLRTA